MVSKLTSKLLVSDACVIFGCLFFFDRHQWTEKILVGEQIILIDFHFRIEIMTLIDSLSCSDYFRFLYHCKTFLGMRMGWMDKHIKDLSRNQGLYHLLQMEKNNFKTLFRQRQAGNCRQRGDAAKDCGLKSNPSL